MANGRSIGFVMGSGRFSPQIGVMDARSSSNWIWMMSMISLLSLLALMVVMVIRRGAGNGGGRGNMGGKSNRTVGSNGRGNGAEGGTENETGSVGERGQEMGGGSGEDANTIPVSIYFERAGISVSTGHHPNVPLEENVHKKTLKAIARDHWPSGAVDSVGKPRSQYFDDEYYKSVLDEFQKYYDYEEGVHVPVMRAKVKAHLKIYLKSMLSWELGQANKKVQKSAPGNTQHDVKPLHIQPDAWYALCDWWDSPKFQAISNQNKKNWKRKMLLHTTGAKPYIIFRQELGKKEKRILTLVEFFDATHEKKKQKGNFWTPEATSCMRALLVKGWDEYTRNHNISEANISSPAASPPMSPNKRLRTEAEVACTLSKELGTHAHKKNRLFMGRGGGGCRANLSDIYNGDELLVQRRECLTPTHGASLSPELLQRAIGTAAIIVHAYDSDVSVARREIEDHIQQLEAEVIEKEDMLWVEYTQVAFSMVPTIFAEYKKTITEDSHDGRSPHISDDELFA